ncbi:MAG TPA: long-chain fatty acid--CoA ligase [Candidatus Limnocylindria bacterium]|nr:long-chain fatty acid--CoA ligase [Candidatus Limnocylindria bacterium]
MTPSPTQAPRKTITDPEPLVVPPEYRANNLVELIARAVDTYPTNEAMRWKPSKAQRAEPGAEATDDGGWVHRSYREMWDWVTELSLGLRHLGLADGDRFCIISRTRPEWVIADFAGLALGAVSCPIYPQSEAGQAAFVVNNVGAKIVVVENAQQAAKIASVRAQCPTLEHVITIDAHGKFPDGTLTYDDVMARADTDPAERRVWRETFHAIEPDHLACVIHTSGTTANPKGVMITHGGLVYQYQAARQLIDLHPTDVFLSWLPLAHSFEKVTGEVLPFAIGAAVAYAEPLIERLPANMVEVRPTVMAGVPRLFERVYGRVRATIDTAPPLRQKIFGWAIGLGAKRYANHLAGRKDSPWLSAQVKLADALVYKKVRERTGGRVRYFVSGAAPLSREVGEFFYALGMLVLEGYGMTEASPLISVTRPADIVFGTVGQPAPGTQVKIEEFTGEVCSRGPGTMVGYINEPDETAKAVDRDGWLHTGDVGELDEAGRLRITDRLKNIIVLANGKNVSPGPMEAALSTSRLVAQAVILGDNQPYTGVLIAPDFDELGRWAAGNGLAEMPPEQLVEEKSVQRLLEGEVKRLLEGFAIYERPRRVALLPRLLSEEEGELTPTLKTKLRVVQAKWADKIGYLFDEKGGGTD